MAVKTKITPFGRIVHGRAYRALPSGDVQTLRNGSWVEHVPALDNYADACTYLMCKWGAALMNAGK